MSEFRVIKNQNGDIVLPKTKWCQSAWCHFKGLQFASPLDDTEGLIFVYGRESITNTSIHMFFVFFEIAVVWLDSSGIVVDKKLAKPWRPAYAPAKAAQYFIEANPSLLERVNIGDKLSFDKVVS